MAKTNIGTINRVTAFIDWDNARRIVRADVKVGRKRYAERAILLIQDAMADVLARKSKDACFRVSMRIYHGWFSGRTKTPDRIEMEQLRLKGVARRVENVIFAPELGMGDRLLCGGQRCQLFDLVRRREDSDGDEQKMVDTAIISDLLHFSKSKLGDVAIIVGDDDDLLPGAITAEAWGTNVIVLRICRRDDNKTLNTEGLIHRSRSIL